MYKIKCDDFTLYNPLKKDLVVSDPILDLEVNRVGSLKFSMYSKHTYYDKIVKMKSIITVLQDDKVLFKGRVYSDTVNFLKVKTIKVEGLLAYFNDSIVRPYTFTGSVSEYLTFLITQHNEQVSDAQKFKIGNITVTDPNDYITRASSNLPNTWAEIKEKLIKLLGGYIVIRYEEDGNYIDYLADFSDTSTQEIKFAVNLMDLENIVKGDSLSTCIIPYGAKIEKSTTEDDIEPVAEDEEIEERVTIKEVNDGIDFIQNDEAVALYGKIFEVITWDDVTDPSNLLRKAKEYLQNKIKLQNTLTLSAVDLHLTDKDIEPFKVGDYIQVKSDPHGIKETMLLTSISIPLTRPDGYTFTLGRESSSFVDTQISNERNTSNELTRIDIVDKKVDDVNNSIDSNIEETVKYVNTLVENSQEYTRELLKEYTRTGDTETLINSVSTEIETLAGEINLRFTTLNETLTNENGELRREIEQITKYVRIVDGDLILGEVDNPLTTKLINGRLTFFINGSEVAYISDNKLYITTAEILESIVIGNFAFKPRANGNLSFTKVR